MNSDQLKQLLNLAGQSYNPPPTVPRDEMWSRIRLARDFNKLREAAPHETMWQNVSLMRAPKEVLRSGRETRRGARISGRDVRGSTWRGRGRWMVVPALGLAAATLIAMIQMRPAAETVSTLTFAQGAPTLWQHFALQSSEIDRYPLDLSGRWYSAAAEDPVSEAYRRAAIIHLKKSESLITTFRLLSNELAMSRNTRTVVGRLLSNTRLLLSSPASIQAHYRGVFMDLELVLVKMTLLTPATVSAERALIETTLERRKLIVRMRDLIPAPSSSNAN